MSESAKLRVLVVGAGRRVQGNFLPVLRALDAQFSILGVHARTAARLQPVADRWGVPAVATLAGASLEAADVVALSVPTAQNPVVLRALLPQAARLSVVIDTPIAWTRQELAATAPLLARFRRVVVTEDYMNFPEYALARQAVAAGLIGTPTALTLTNTGYLYHGLALIRSFVGFRRAVRTWRRRVGGMTTLVGYRFPGGFEACVIGPYRRHSTGGFLLEGTAGAITQFPADLGAATASRPVHLLAPRRDAAGRLDGYAIGALDLIPAELAAMHEMPFDDKSDLNLQRGCGLASVFRSLIQDDGLNTAYGAENAFYDSFISRLAERGRLPIDPLTWLGRDAMTAVRALGHLKS